MDDIQEDFRIGFEATGHYGLNLMLFLEKHDIPFMELNPVLVQKFILSHSLRRTKTDKTDAASIASYLASAEFNPYPKKVYKMFSLKSLTRFRSGLIHQRSQSLVRITNVLDCIFPEFKPFFKKKFSTTALYILNNYLSPEKIANMNSCSYDKLRSISRGKFSMAQFVQLKQLAKNTVGETNDIMLYELQSLLALYRHLDENIKDTEKKIENIILELNPPTLSIRGIGVQSAAIIIAEYGDFSRFHTPAKMISFAGIEPGISQSGTYEHSGKMVKHGSAHLRYAILNCAGSVILHNEVFANYYYKKISEGKCHRVALSHVAKKLIRVIFKLESTHTIFDPLLLC